MFYDHIELGVRFDSSFNKGGMLVYFLILVVEKHLLSSFLVVIELACEPLLGLGPHIDDIPLLVDEHL